MELSKKSKTFLEDLRVYLFASGKKFDDVDEILGELESHLIEAEKNGKAIEQVIGNSPKEYMEMISDEMPEDKPGWVMYTILIIVGALAFTVIPDLLQGNIAYSLLEVIGHIVIVLTFVAAILVGFKYISTTNQTFKMKALTMVGIGVLPIGLFIGLIYLNNAIATPIIHFGNTGTYILAGIMALFIIGISIWARTWLLIFILALLTLPDYLMTFTPFSEEIQLILGTVITFGGLFCYILISSKLQKDKSK